MNSTEKKEARLRLNIASLLMEEELIINQLRNEGLPELEAISIATAQIKNKYYQYDN